MLRTNVKIKSRSLPLTPLFDLAVFEWSELAQDAFSSIVEGERCPASLSVKVLRSALYELVQPFDTCIRHGCLQPV